MPKASHHARWIALAAAASTAIAAAHTGQPPQIDTPTPAAQPNPRPNPQPEPTEQEQAPPRPFLLLVEDAIQPTVTVRWTTAQGESIELAAPRPYAHDNDRTELGENLTAYAALGGSRISKNAGHPRGAVVRVGFYKLQPAKPLFRGIARDGIVEVTLTGIRFNQPVAPSPRSLVQHLKYDPEDLEACGLPGDAREQFNTQHPAETLNDRVRPGIDARLGLFAGPMPTDIPRLADTDPQARPSEPLGETALTLADDGTIEMTARFAYPALRNIRDPWRSDIPGTFLEPIHFHLEFEVLPEGVEPLDPARPRRVGAPPLPDPSQPEGPLD
ncbi:MAG: hypothetical protein AAF356_00950 [Planctomycetota bacterium]